MNPEDGEFQSGKRLFFVTGRNKSGTTWMANILNSHPELFCDKSENNAFHPDMEIIFSGKRTSDIHVSVGDFYKSRYLK
jgi:Sulfotransferase family